MFSYDDIKVGDTLISKQGCEYKVLDVDKRDGSDYYFYLEDMDSRQKKYVVAPEGSEGRFGLKKHIHA